MDIYVTIIGVIAGLCLAFGLMSLFIGVRRSKEKQLNYLLATFALSYGGTLLLGTRFRGATSGAEFLSITRWDGIFVPLAFISLLYYVSLYTKVRPRILLWPLTPSYLFT